MTRSARTLRTECLAPVAREAQTWALEDLTFPNTHAAPEVEQRETRPQAAAVFKTSSASGSGAPKEQPESAEPQKGTDLEYGLNIDFWQAIRGTQVRLTISKQEVCSVCGGSGAKNGANTVCPEFNGSGNVTQMAGAMRFSLTCPRCEGTGRLKNNCPNCHGDGRVSTPETVDVRIPPGAQQGSRLRVQAKGNAGTHGAPPGDLYITVRVDEHPFFRRDGDDIEITLPVRIDEAGLGAKIEVPTIDGRARLSKSRKGQQPAEVSSSRKGRGQFTRPVSRGDQDCDRQHGSSQGGSG